MLEIDRPRVLEDFLPLLRGARVAGDVPAAVEVRQFAVADDLQRLELPSRDRGRRARPRRVSRAAVRARRPGPAAESRAPWRWQVASDKNDDSIVHRSLLVVRRSATSLTAVRSRACRSIASIGRYPVSQSRYTPIARVRSTSLSGSVPHATPPRHGHASSACLTILMIVVIAGASGSLSAQWFNVPESTSAAHGQRAEVDLAAAPPRLANGRRICPACG